MLLSTSCTLALPSFVSNGISNISKMACAPAKPRWILLFTFVISRIGFKIASIEAINDVNAPAVRCTLLEAATKMIHASATAATNCTLDVLNAFANATLNSRNKFVLIASAKRCDS